MQEFDVLVIGARRGGIAAAIAAKQAGAKVALLTKVHPLRTNTGLAQGGINAPLGRTILLKPTPATFFKPATDLCDPGVVQAFTQQAGNAVMWLERMGMPFTAPPTANSTAANSAPTGRPAASTWTTAPATW